MFGVDILPQPIIYIEPHSNGGHMPPSYFIMQLSIVSVLVIGNSQM